MKNKFIFLSLVLALSPALCAAQDTALLGGMVQSDRWIIRKDKMEEEFIGNVSYKNDIYNIKADYALSRRKEQTFTLKGNVFASQKKDDLPLGRTREFDVGAETAGIRCISFPCCQLHSCGPSRSGGTGRGCNGLWTG